jgi:DtxR family transcriptional regulator, Mn-dependent transcriptional regulator
MLATVGNETYEPSKPEREALKAIYRATRDRVEAQTGALADALAVTPGTVTATLKRLADEGLLDYRPYRGARLTTTGEHAAIRAIRRHRIVERFLADMLGYAWNEADRLAVTFEHNLPGEVEDRLFAALNRPGTCPHGFPIPAKEAAEIPDTPPLYDLEPGDRGVVAVPGDTEPDLVDFLETLGIRPGVEFVVREKHPFDGPLVLDVDGQTRTLGHRVAKQVFVQAADAPEEAPEEMDT